MIGVIARRELLASLRSPFAWLLFAATQFICAWQFLSLLDMFQEYQARLRSLDSAPGLTDLVVTPTFMTGAFVLLLLIPAVTMRAFSEERAQGTLVLLLAAPLRSVDVVLGKFCGTLLLLLVPVLIIAMLPVTLLAGGSFDLGQYFGALIGLLLLTGFATAIGLYLSALTAHPALAAIASLLLLLLLWTIGTPAGGEPAGWLPALSIAAHLQNPLNGILDSADLAYFLGGTAVFLLLAVQRLAGERRSS